MAKNPGKTNEQDLIGRNPEEQHHDDQGGAPPRERHDDEDGIDVEAALEDPNLSDHIRLGLVDPSPSVREEFRTMLAEMEGKRARRGDEPPKVYRGPFTVQHPFMVAGRDIGDARTEVTVDGRERPISHRITHVMPSAKGGFTARVLKEGDLPDDMMQALWADGVLKPFEPEKPKPVRKPIPRALPRFTDLLERSAVR